MPHPDPVPGPSHGALRGVRRAVRAMAAASLGMAVLAVALDAIGSDGWHVRILIGMALGTGLVIFLTTALIGLVFMSPPSGHDESAGRFEESDET